MQGANNEFADRRSAHCVVADCETSDGGIADCQPANRDVSQCEPCECQNANCSTTECDSPDGKSTKGNGTAGESAQSDDSASDVSDGDDSASMSAKFIVGRVWADGNGDQGVLEKGRGRLPADWHGNSSRQVCFRRDLAVSGKRGTGNQSVLFITIRFRQLM